MLLGQQSKHCNDMKYLKSRKAGFNLISLIGILILSSFYSCKEKGIVLTENGKTDYEIVTTENSDDKVIFSAKELQNYLQKMSKVEIPVVDEKAQNKNKK